MPMVPTSPKDDANTHTRKRFINANEFLQSNPRGTSGKLKPAAAKSQAMAAAISFEKKTSGSTKGLPKKKTSKGRKNSRATIAIPFFGGGSRKKTRKRKIRSRT